VTARIPWTASPRTSVAGRQALVQCLAGEPVAILVELSGMTVTEPDAANIFPTIIQQADIWPGTPLLLCAPDPTTASWPASWSPTR
jgi:hypothetical protein